MKRIAATLLWFYTGWYVGSIIATLIGVPDLLGPIVGIAAGTLVAIDPRRLIWTPSPSPATRARLAGLNGTTRSVGA